jgi:hypothetical protein
MASPRPSRLRQSFSKSWESEPIASPPLHRAWEYGLVHPSGSSGEGRCLTRWTSTVPGVRGSVRAPLRAPARVAFRWADDGFPSATDASWSWNAGSIAGLALGVGVDCCLAAQWDVVWQVRVQRCSDGASHSRRHLGGGGGYWRCVTRWKGTVPGFRLGGGRGRALDCGLDNPFRIGRWGGGYPGKPPAVAALG